MKSTWTDNPYEVAIRLAAGGAVVLVVVAGSATGWEFRERAADFGGRQDVAAVKSAVVADLERDKEIMRPEKVPSDLRAQLSEIYAPSVLDTVTAETGEAMREAAADPSYTGYVANRFTVKRWQVVRATHTAAVVILVGFNSWRSPGAPDFDRDDVVHQWHVALAKDGGRWKLVHEAAFAPGEGVPYE